MPEVLLQNVCDSFSHSLSLSHAADRQSLSPISRLCTQAVLSKSSEIVKYSL